MTLTFIANAMALAGIVTSGVLLIKAFRRAEPGATTSTQHVLRNTIETIVETIVERGSDVVADVVGGAVDATPAIHRWSIRRTPFPDNLEDLGDLTEFHGQGTFKKLYEKANDADPWTTPLHVGVCYEWLGHVNFIEDIVSRGVDINAQDGEGNTALHHLAEHLRSIGNAWEGTIEAMKWMLRAGANPLIRNKAGKLAMECVNVYGSTEAALSGCDDEHLLVELFLSAVTQGAQGGVEIPHDFVADPNEYRYLQSHEHTSLGALYRACETLNLEGVRAALKAGADLNVRDVDLDEDGCLDDYTYHHPVDVLLHQNRDNKTTPQQIKTMGEILDVMIDAGLDQVRLAKWAEGRMSASVAREAIGRILAKAADETMAEAPEPAQRRARARL